MPYLPTALPTDHIRRYYTESCNKITSHAIITDGFSVGNAVDNYPWNYRRIYSVGNVPAGNLFFGAHVSVCITVGVSVGGWFFLFATELATEMRFTDDCYTDGRVPSVLFLLTDFIAVTDGMSPSVKLDNVVVKKDKMNCCVLWIFNSWCLLFLLCVYIYIYIYI